MKRAHQDHERTIQKVLSTLIDLGLNYTLTPDLFDEVAGYDLVVTLGGDGTLLYVSHFVNGSTPVLAINTAPKDSVGYFCANPEIPLRELLYNAVSLSTTGLLWKVRRVYVSRMAVSVDEELVTSRALNDVLFCHSHPAMMSKYLFQTEDKEPEEQMSSGIWVSTAAGSTAAIRSAGGFTMPHDNPNIQFKVREPYQPAGRRLENVHGFVRPGEKINIRSKNEEGYVYVDGSHINHPVTRGQTLTIEHSPEPLALLAFRQRTL